MMMCPPASFPHSESIANSYHIHRNDVLEQSGQRTHLHPQDATRASSKGGESMSDASKCPFGHTAGGGKSNSAWWPNQLNLKVLHQQSALSDPMPGGFDYAKEFKSLDLAAVKRDLHALMT